jgi:cellulose synthase/poly-beta-1,6-N-acetylglucosamine synthase-like glycosyltransferase
MSSKPLVSLVISYYKNLSFLELVLKGVERQSFRNFEVIIAEDDDSKEMKNFLQDYKPKNPYDILLVSQADLGFRKNKILNEAVRKSKGDILVFIDGDCIPHTHFLYHYAKEVKQGNYFIGRRVMISNKLTSILLKENSISKLNFLNLLITKPNRIEDGIYFPSYGLSKKSGILGSNWGLTKYDFLAVNGFDEDYITAGVGEDVDIEWRLDALGFTPVSMKYKSLQYHLDHPFHYDKEVVMKNMEILENKKNLGHYFCLNGYEKSKL